MQVNRNLPFEFRVLIAVSVFVGVTAGTLAATYYSMSALEQGRFEEVAMAVLLFIWCILGYFPARYAYVAVTYRKPDVDIQCQKCGYDLRGNQTTVCPECGRGIELTELLEQLGLSGNVAERPRVRKDRPLARTLGGTGVGVAVIATVLLGGYWLYHGRQTVTPADLAAAEFAPARSPFSMLRWAQGSDMAEIDPDSLYAVLGPSIRARFTFLSAAHEALESVGVYDVRGRPCFDIDVATKRYHINLYSPEDSAVDAEPVATIRDTDGNGIPDRRVDWSMGITECLLDAETWGPCAPPSGN